MSRKHRQRLTIWDLGRLETVPVPERGDATAGESLAQFRRRYDAEQETARQAPITAAIEGQSQAVRGLNAHAKSFWQQSLDAIIPKLYTELSRDAVLSLPITRDQYETGDIRKSFDVWTATILPKTGYTLTGEGEAGSKMVRYLLAQAYHGQDVSTPAAIQTCFERLLELEALSDGTTFDPAKAPHKAPAPEPKVDLEALNISGNSEHERLARKTVTEQMYAEGSPLHHEWLTSLYEGFDGFRPTEADLDYIYNFAFPRNNLSYVDRRSFDFIRRHMCAIGKWDSNRLLTADEKLCAEIDALDYRNMSFDERQAVQAKLMRQRKQSY